MFLLRREGGLRAEDVARLTGRQRETVHRATQQVAVAVGHDELIADLVRRAQRLLASPHLDGRAYAAPVVAFGWPPTWAWGRAPRGRVNEEELSALASALEKVAVDCGFG